MDKNISLGEAFRYCASFPSYWLIVAIPVVVFILGFILSEKYGKKKNVDVSDFKMILGIVCFLGLVAAIGIAPFNVKENTTKAKAAEGKYIGF